MSYIIIVHPAILSDAGMYRAALITATCLATALGSFLVGLWANVPFAMATGMGLNAFFAYIRDVMIEVAWVSVSADSTSEEIILPKGSYDLVVSPAGESSYKVEGGIAIVADAETNVVYQPPAP